MNLKNFVPAILAILGLSTFKEVEGKKVVTEDEKKTLNAYGFPDAFLRDFEAALNTPEAPAGENRENAVVAAALGQVTQQLEASNAELARMQADARTSAEQIQQQQTEIASLRERVQILSDVREQDPGATAGRQAAPGVSAINLDDEAQLGGRPGAMFALDRPYNQRARAALLAQQGRTVTVATADSFDYSTLRDDLGAFYRQTWRDRLQSLLVELPTIESIFPLESGYQDLATLVNIWLGEFSQADNTVGSDFDRVAKGSYNFSHETLRMYGVMFVHKFRDLAQLERLWIGSLNREGSDPIKWSFIEYILAETAKKLHNERELRRINGVRKNPVPNEPGRALEAADGVYEFLRKKVEGHIDFTPDGGTTGKTVYQIKPFALPRITQANIGEVFYQGTSMIPGVFRDTGKLILYVPSFMVPWYHKYLETNYGQNRDYVAGQMYVHEYPSVKIVAIPNADNHHRIFWTIDGNIKCYQQAAGEMLNFRIEQVDWTLKVHSHWKESIWAEAVGYKYTNPAEMDGSRQLIWCNDYDMPDTFFVEGPANANPSALRHTSIVTAANSAVFPITDIADAKVGQVVSIKCGADGDNGVKIEKSGKFELISEAWTPKKGDVINLMKRADGKFIELGRITAATDAFAFAADDTTPSVDGATVFVTNENTEATAITAFDDAISGVVYTIHGAGSDNASTIANSGNFVLTAPMVLSAGKFIKVVKSTDGKFYEVARAADN